MTKYQVHFEYKGYRRNTNTSRLCRGIRTVKARNEAEAILKVRSVVIDSFGHWANRLANEAA